MGKYLRTILLLLIFLGVFSILIESVSAENFGDFRITGPHSQDKYFNMFAVRAGDPINLELKLSIYIGIWHPQDMQWINITVYDSKLNYIRSEYTQTDLWTGVAKPQTFSINKTGTYILAANYTNGTKHCFTATAFYVL